MGPSDGGSRGLGRRLRPSSPSRFPIRRAPNLNDLGESFSGDSGDVRRSRPCRSVSSGTSAPSSAATRTPAAWPTTGCSRPATPRPSTTPADARPSANSCPTPSTSIAPPWSRSTRCSASTRDAPGPTSARSRGQPDQAAPPVGQGLVSRLPRLRDRPAPGPAAEHQAEPAVPRDRQHRLRRQREPADPPPQGDVPAARPPAPRKFERLTRQEEKHGLLDETATIGTKDGWQDRLNATGFVLRGHRLVRR